MTRPSVDKLIEMLEEFIDWENGTWKINSDHPYDKDAASDWQETVDKAKKLVVETRGQL